MSLFLPFLIHFINLYFMMSIAIATTGNTHLTINTLSKNCIIPRILPFNKFFVIIEWNIFGFLEESVNWF